MKYSFQYEQAPAFCSVTKNSHIRTTDSTVIGLHSMIDMRIQVIMQYITGVTGHMCHVANLNNNNKQLYDNRNGIPDRKLRCRIETTRRFVSLNTFLSHSRSLEMTLFSRAYVSPYLYVI